MNLDEQELHRVTEGMSKNDLERIFRISILDQVRNLREAVDELTRKVEKVGLSLNDIQAEAIKSDLKSVKESLANLEKSVVGYNIPGVVEEVKNLSQRFQKIHDKVLVLNTDEFRNQLGRLDEAFRRREILLSDDKIKSMKKELETLSRFKVQILAILGVLLSLGSWLWNIFFKFH